jgi:predicted lipoprotein
MKKLALLLIIASFTFVACDKKNKKPVVDEPAAGFNKQALLINLADNVIIPDYKAFEKALDELNAAYTSFKQSFAVTDLKTVKEKFHMAYLTYQQISLYEFGPAEQVVVRMNFNVFPTDTGRINNNISGGTYQLDLVNNFAAKGLPALDFLFYGNNSSENSIAQLFKNDANRVKYVSDLLADMNSKIKTVVNVWTSGYRTTFINSLSTDIGSSIGFAVNQINFELDYLKNAKVGIPLGKKTLDYPMPDNCEAYYGGQSVEYALATLLAIEKLYLGKSAQGINGQGFDDYLDHLKIKHGAKTLNNAINDQFAVAREKLSAVAKPLSAQVTESPAVVDIAYIELVKLLVLLKTDMPSNLGVVISYQDGDGD